MDFYRGGPKTHLVVTRLIAELAHHHCVAGRRICRSLKRCLYLEITCKDRQELVAYFDLLCLWIGDALDFKRAAGPSQLQRDQEFVFRLVIIDVKPRFDRDLKLLGDGSSALYSDLLRRMND